VVDSTLDGNAGQYSEVHPFSCRNGGRQTPAVRATLGMDSKPMVAVLKFIEVPKENQMDARG